MTSAARSWILRLTPAREPRKPLVRLICFGHAGASGASFRRWVAGLPPEVELLAAQLPGRDGQFGEAPCMDMAALIERLVEELLPELEQPFALFGHSFGALVAFELARELRRQGLPGPRHLFVSGRGDPYLPRHARAMHELSDPELISALRLMNATAPEMLDREDWLRVLLPAIRADLTAAGTYEPAPEPPLLCPITAYAGTADPGAGSEVLRTWERHTRGPFTVHTFPGDHFYLFHAPDDLLAEMTRALLR